MLFDKARIVNGVVGCVIMVIKHNYFFIDCYWINYTEIRKIIAVAICMIAFSTFLGVWSAMTHYFYVKIADAEKLMQS